MVIRMRNSMVEFVFTVFQYFDPYGASWGSDGGQTGVKMSNIAHSFLNGDLDLKRSLDILIRTGNPMVELIFAVFQ